MTSSPWWAPHVYADRRPFLLARSRITAAVRAWFAARDFVEVETAILQVSPGNEAHLHAFSTELIAPDASRHPLYLHTSPEFASKKLLAAGEPRLFTFARVFRNRERWPLHHPEFTMLEWYRANEPYGMLIDGLRGAAGGCGRGRRDAGASLSRARSRPVRGAGAADGGGGVPRYANIDLLATRLEEDRDALAAAAQRQGIRVADDDTWADVFSRVLVERIEPNLGNRPRDNPRRISGVGGRAGAADRA